MQMRRASPSTIASKLHSSDRPNERRTAVAVYLHVRGPHAQPEQRAPHRQIGRLQDVQVIDLFDVGPRDRPRDRAGADLDCELGALLRLDQLGVADAADAPPRIEDHRGRDDGSRQRSAPRLIDAGAQTVANQIERQLCRTHRSPSTQQCNDGLRRTRAGVPAQRLVDRGESLHELIAIGTLQLRQHGGARARRRAPRR
jgi:hypothetical protein